MRDVVSLEKRVLFYELENGRKRHESVSDWKIHITKKKRKNLTQEQLADKLDISNKTISKWETGKCMPNYTIIQSLCKELEIAISELMNGEENHENNVRTYDEKQMIDLVRRTQELEKQKIILYGFMLIIMGVALLAVSHIVGGSQIKDFFSGLLLGLSIGEMLIGCYIVGRGIINS